MLNEILGQQTVVKALTESLSADHLSQTYLFAGEHHVGKTTTAIALAKVLLCEHREPGQADSCDSCAACKTVTNGTHPDVRIVSPAGPSRMLRIPQFWPRDGVKDHPADKAMLRDLHFSPVSGKRRIFVIEAAESMNEDTANSLLKVLEEPPPYAMFILTAVATEAVLPTILSRSQALRFRPVAESLILAELLRRGVKEERARILAAYAQGRPGIAFNASTNEGSLIGHDEVLAIASESSNGHHVIAAFKLAEELRKASTKLTDAGGGSQDDTAARTLLANACDILVLWYRDLLIRKSTNSSDGILNRDRAELIGRQVERYSVDNLEHAINLIQDTRRYIGRNANAQVASEYLMLNLLSLGSH